MNLIFYENFAWKKFKKSLKILKLEYWLSQNISKKDAQKYKGR